MADPKRIKPYGSWILVKVDKPPVTTESGLLFIPEGNRDEIVGHTTATVVSVGHGVLCKKGRWTPFGFGPGDRVMFRRYLGGLPFHMPEESDRFHALVHAKDIVGVLE